MEKYDVRDGLYYTKDHEWVKIEGDTGVVGISHYASTELGDIAYIELPKLVRVAQGGKMCEIESVKAVSDIYAPVTGTILAVNNTLIDSPQSVNEDPYGAWIAKIKIEDKAEVGKLMSAQQYREYIKTLKE